MLVVNSLPSQADYSHIHEHDGEMVMAWTKDLVVKPFDGNHGMIRRTRGHLRRWTSRRESCVEFDRGGPALTQRPPQRDSDQTVTTGILK